MNKRAVKPKRKSSKRVHDRISKSGLTRKVGHGATDSAFTNLELFGSAKKIPTNRLNTEKVYLQTLVGPHTSNGVIDALFDEYGQLKNINQIQVTPSLVDDVERDIVIPVFEEMGIHITQEGDDIIIESNPVISESRTYLFSNQERLNRILYLYGQMKSKISDPSHAALVGEDQSISSKLIAIWKVQKDIEKQTFDKLGAKGYLSKIIGVEDDLFAQIAALKQETMAKIDKLNEYYKGNGSPSLKYRFFINRHLKEIDRNLTKIEELSSKVRDTIGSKKVKFKITDDELQSKIYQPGPGSGAPEYGKILKHTIQKVNLTPYHVSEIGNRNSPKVIELIYDKLKGVLKQANEVKMDGAGDSLDRNFIETITSFSDLSHKLADLQWTTNDPTIADDLRGNNMRSQVVNSIGRSLALVTSVARGQWLDSTQKSWENTLSGKTPNHFTNMEADLITKLRGTFEMIDPKAESRFKDFGASNHELKLYLDDGKLRTYFIIPHLHSKIYYNAENDIELNSSLSLVEKEKIKDILSDAFSTTIGMNDAAQLEFRGFESVLQGTPLVAFKLIDYYVRGIIESKELFSDFPHLRQFVNTRRDQYLSTLNHLKQVVDADQNFMDKLEQFDFQYLVAPEEHELSLIQKLNYGLSVTQDSSYDEVLAYAKKLDLIETFEEEVTEYDPIEGKNVTKTIEKIRYKLGKKSAPTSIFKEGEFSPLGDIDPDNYEENKRNFLYLIESVLGLNDSIVDDLKESGGMVENFQKKALEIQVSNWTPYEVIALSSVFNFPLSNSPEDMELRKKFIDRMDESYILDLIEKHPYVIQLLNLKEQELDIMADDYIDQTNALVTNVKTQLQQVLRSVNLEPEIVTIHKKHMKAVKEGDLDLAQEAIHQLKFIDNPETISTIREGYGVSLQTLALVNDNISQFKRLRALGNKINPPIIKLKSENGRKIKIPLDEIHKSLYKGILSVHTPKATLFKNRPKNYPPKIRDWNFRTVAKQLYSYLDNVSGSLSYGDLESSIEIDPSDIGGKIFAEISSIDGIDNFDTYESIQSKIGKVLRGAIKKRFNAEGEFNTPTNRYFRKFLTNLYVSQMSDADPLEYTHYLDNLSSGDVETQSALRSIRSLHGTELVSREAKERWGIQFELLKSLYVNEMTHSDGNQKDIFDRIKSDTSRLSYSRLREAYRAELELDEEGYSEKAIADALTVDPILDGIDMQETFGINTLLTEDEIRSGVDQSLLSTTLSDVIGSNKALQDAYKSQIGINDADIAKAIDNLGKGDRKPKGDSSPKGASSPPSNESNSPKSKKSVAEAKKQEDPQKKMKEVAQKKSTRLIDLTNKLIRISSGFDGLVSGFNTNIPKNKVSIKENTFMKSVGQTGFALSKSADLMKATLQSSNPDKLTPGEQRILQDEYVRSQFLIKDQILAINKRLPQRKIQAEDLNRLGIDNDSFLTSAELIKRGVSSKAIDEYEKEYPNISQLDMHNIAKALIVQSENLKKFEKILSIHSKKSGAIKIEPIRFDLKKEKDIDVSNLGALDR